MSSVVIDTIILSTLLASLYNISLKFIAMQTSIIREGILFIYLTSYEVATAGCWLKKLSNVVSIVIIDGAMRNVIC